MIRKDGVSYRVSVVSCRVLATVGGVGRYRPALRISARLLGSNWMCRPAQIELKFAEYVVFDRISS